MTGTAQIASGSPCPDDCKNALIDRMARTLRSLGCRCTHNVPYSGSADRQVVTHECARCRCIREYDELNSPPSTSVHTAQASTECRGNAAGGAP